jgi:hypothetical protein
MSHLKLTVTPILTDRHPQCTYSPIHIYLISFSSQNTSPHFFVAPMFGLVHVEATVLNWPDLSNFFIHLLYFNPNFHTWLTLYSEDKGSRFLRLIGTFFPKGHCLTS